MRPALRHTSSHFILSLEVTIPILQIRKLAFIAVERGSRVTQSVARPTSAQVMISQHMRSSPAWGSVLAARSLEPVSDSVSPSLSAPSLHSLSLSLSLKNKH